MAIVLGFGEIILPAFPPPIMANKTDGLLYPAVSAIDMAMGATVITEISTKTTTAQSKTLPQFLDNHIRDFFRSTGLDESTGQNTGSEDAKYG